MSTPQENFDERYVTSMELCVDLGVSRTSILNRRRAGQLPEAIEVKTRDGSIHLLLWVREQVKPHIDQWREQLGKRGA